LADQWGADGIAELFDTYGLTRPSNLPIVTQIPQPSPPPEDPTLAALGQENLTVSPLQIALAFSMIVNNGRLPTPQLVEAVETESREWETVQGPGEPGEQQVVEPEVARQVWESLAGNMTGDDAPIAEHAVTVLAGPEGSTNSWYAGLATVDSINHYVVLLVLEGETDTGAANQIGRQVLGAVLDEMTR
jgi:peptidoglycan glycosyltransferase